MERMHVVQHQVIRNVHHEGIVQYDQVVVVVVLHDSSQIQINVAVKQYQKQNIVVIHDNT